MLLEEMSDEDLIFLINSGSKLAEMAIYRRYGEYARHQANNYYFHFRKSGISVDEFYAVAFSKVHDALKKQEDITSNFYIYWKTMVKNAIYDYVKHNSYESGAKAFAGLSLDGMCYDDNEVITFNDIVGENEKSSSLMDILNSYVYGDEILLSDEEKLIAELYIIKDSSIQEIMDITHLSRSRVNYLIKTTKKKIQKLLKENYL